MAEELRSFNEPRSMEANCAGNKMESDFVVECVGRAEIIIRWLSSFAILLTAGGSADDGYSASSERQNSLSTELKGSI